MKDRKKSRNPFAGKIMRAAWDEEAQANQGRVEPGAVIRRAMDMVTDDDLEALRGSAARIAFEQEDERRREVANSLQLDLFTGNFEALNGSIPTANGGRVDVPYALMEDWLVWIDIGQQHADKVNRVQGQRIRTFTQLAPYFTTPETNTMQAIEQFRRRAGFGTGGPPPPTSPGP